MQTGLDTADIRNSIGKKIRILRERAGITQVDLAKLVGMRSTGAISQIENGERGIKLHAIIRVAEALGVHPMVLLTLNDFDEQELSLLADLTRLFRKARRDPSRARAHIDAIKKILNE